MAKAAKSDKETRRQKVIEVLNKARSMELHGISQYMNQIGRASCRERV